MNFKEKRVLVTGGAGFIGSEGTSQLLNNGAFVTVLDNFSSGKKEYLPKNKKLKIVKGDITDEQISAKSVKDNEIVINLAALPFIPDSFYFPTDFFNVNTIGSVNMILQSVRSKSVESFVQISTSEVYGTAQHVPMDENHPTAPHSTYAVSKLAADRAAFTLHKENGFPTVVIRPFNSFGPRYTEPYIIPEIMNQILSGSPYITLGNVSSSRDFTYVSDTADAIIKSSVAKKILGWKPKISTEKGLKITFEWAKKNKITFKAPFKRWYLKNDNTKKSQ